MYNVKSLVDECARFITNNMMTSNPYQQDWMEQMKGSPDLMLKIIKELNRSGLVLDGSPEDDEEAQAQAQPRRMEGEGDVVMTWAMGGPFD